MASLILVFQVCSFHIGQWNHNGISIDRHQYVVSIDTRRAEALPGVFATLVGSELPTPYCVIPWTRDETALCIDKVRYIGDAVAAVSGKTLDLVRDAIEKIRAEYDAEEHNVDFLMDEQAPLLDSKGNIDEEWDEEEKIDAALAAAAHTHTGTYTSTCTYTYTYTHTNTYTYTYT